MRAGAYINSGAPGQSTSHAWIIAGNKNIRVQACDSKGACAWSNVLTINITAPCLLPWGGTIAHNGSVLAHQFATVPCGSVCGLSEDRVCNNGVLSGTYTNQNCSVAACVDGTCGTAITTGPCATAPLNDGTLCGAGSSLIGAVTTNSIAYNWKCKATSTVLTPCSVKRLCGALYTNHSCIIAGSCPDCPATQSTLTATCMMKNSYGNFVVGTQDDCNNAGVTCTDKVCSACTTPGSWREVSPN